MSQDITELKEKEEAVRRLQKMESIGMLAGGIAHDFNNLLVTINGYSEMGGQMTDAADPVHEFFEEIHKSGQRAASLTQQLLAYSRKQIVQPKALDLNALVEDMRKLLSRLIGEDIRMETTLDPGLPAIKADPSQMEQVMMNLIVNARDAMPKGGALRIETGTYLAEGAYLEEHPDARPGLHVYLRVADTGMGMEPAVQERIFDPFFTTKPVGKGTGLGLASVYGIVDQCGGHITVESRVGLGSTFTILIPAFSGAGTASERAKNFPHPPRPMPKGPSSWSRTRSRYSNSRALCLRKKDTGSLRQRTDWMPSTRQAISHPSTSSSRTWSCPKCAALTWYGQCEVSCRTSKCS